MRVLCLCNRASGGRPERFDALKDLASKHARVSVVATSDAESAAGALADFQPGAADVLVLSGGDGTIQQAVTVLLHSLAPQGSASDLPMVALLPAGSTNMTALDINTTRRWSAALMRLSRVLATPATGVVKQRRLLTVTDDRVKRSGFFVGAGAIVHGIEYCNSVLWANGAARRERTAGLAMARTIWGVLRAQPPFDEPDLLTVAARSLDPGDERGVLAPPEGALLFASSTLNRLLLGVRPFWGAQPEATNPLRFVLVDRQARLVRNLPGLFGVPGFSRPVAPSGFHSHNCAQLQLGLNQAYAIDGELFQPGRAASTPAAASELMLDADRELRFLAL